MHYGIALTSFSINPSDFWEQDSCTRLMYLRRPDSLGDSTYNSSGADVSASSPLASVPMKKISGVQKNVLIHKDHKDYHL